MCFPSLLAYIISYLIAYVNTFLQSFYIFLSCPFGGGFFFAQKKDNCGAQPLLYNYIRYMGGKDTT